MTIIDHQRPNLTIFDQNWHEITIIEIIFFFFFFFIIFNQIIYLTIALKNFFGNTIDLIIALTKFLEKELTWQLPWKIFWSHNWLDNCFGNFFGKIIDLTIALTSKYLSRPCLAHRERVGVSRTRDIYRNNDFVMCL